MKKTKEPKESKKRKCTICKKLGAKFQTNPYEEEIHEDHTKHWICDKCANELYQEV